MPALVTPWMAFCMCLACTFPTNPSSSDALLDLYAANQDKARSWTVRYESSESRFEGDQAKRGQKESGRVDFDGERVLLHSYRSYSRDMHSVSGEAEAAGVSRYESVIVWDGKQHVNYTGSADKKPGDARITLHERPWEIKYVQRINSTGFLFGYLHNSFERVDRVLRQARRGKALVGSEVFNAMQCFTIETDTTYGKYKVWLDPNHGYALARATVSQDAAHGDMALDSPLSPGVQRTLELNYSGFKRFADMWMATEATCTQETIYKGQRQGYRVDFRLTGFVPNPEPNTLGPFNRDFIPEGTRVTFFPSMQIQYTWHKGKAIAQYEHRLVRELDRVLDGMTADLATEDRPSEAGDDLMRGLLAPWEFPASEEALGPVAVTGGDANLVSVLSQPEPNVSDDPDRGPFRLSHCGLYCIYSILRLTGQRPDFVDLVKPEYLGSYEGSSMPDLIRAAHDNGLFAVPGARLTPQVLRQATCPVILHVRGQVDSAKYEHYELFLGTEEGKAKVLNPPLAPQLMGFGELAALWDGTGLIVSSKAPDVEALFTGERYRLLMAAAIVVLGVVITHGIAKIWSARRPVPSRRWRMVASLGQGCVLALAALACGLCSNVASTGEGLVANSEGIHSIRRAHLGGFVPTVGTARVRQLLGTDAVFIDARYQDDYQAGHLKGAVSVPVRADERQFSDATKGLAKERQLVVYAQSKHCPYAKEVAGRLVEAGFHNIVIFKGGWMEWTSRNGQPVVKEAEKDGGSPKG